MASARKTNGTYLEDPDLWQCRICGFFCKVPKKLVCLHVFCEGCILTYGKSKGYSKQFCCPTCGKATPLPPEGPAGLATNRMVEQLCDMALKAKVTQGCEVCVPNQSKPASMYTCKTCPKGRRFMCRKCKGFHDECLESHDVVVNSQIIAYVKVNYKHLEETCFQHNGKLVQYYCKYCEKAVCLDCRNDLCSKRKMGKHEQVDLSETTKKSRNVLSGLVKRTEEKVLDASMQLQRIEELKCNLIGQVFDRNGSVEKQRRQQILEIQHKEREVLSDHKSSKGVL